MTFRFAKEKDCAIILGFIRALADYEHMSDQVVATEALLREWIFEKKKAEVLFACEGEQEVGFALFFHNFQHFWVAPASTLRTCSYSQSFGAWATEKRSSGNWRRSPSSGDAADWNGPVWTGIGRA